MDQISSEDRVASALDATDRKSRLLHAVNGAAEILLTADEERFADSLRKGMALMAGCMEVDRIYVWQNRMLDGHLQYVQVFEWLRDPEQGAEVVHPRTGFSYRESMPEWEEKFKNGECVNAPLQDLSDTEKERLEPYGIKSILVIPVYLQDCFWGFVSFDDCHNERAFTEDEASILRSGSLMMASVVNRNEIAARVREADEQARLMLDATPLCCTLWKRDLTLIDCNLEAVKLFGLRDKQEYLDRFYELSPEYQPDGSLTTDKVYEYIAKTFREGRLVVTWMHQLLDGTPIPSELTLVRVRRKDEDIVAGYNRDLRESLRMMQEIEYKDMLLRTVNDAASILLHPEIDAFEKGMYQCLGMIAKAVDVDRMYICKNYEKDGQLYGSQIYEWSEEVEPQPEITQDVLYSERAPGWVEVLESGRCINALVRDMSPENQAQLSPQGILSILVVPVFLRDQLWGFVGFDDCHREREFSQIEESILRSASLLVANALLRNEMTHDIQAAVEEAQAANEAKSIFLAHMSHEIRSPMNVIAGMAELILREETSETILEHVLSIKDASSTMLALISDILDFSKIEAGNLEIVTAEYSLASLINNVINPIRMKISEKPILFTANIDRTIPNQLIGDETRVRQILVNVLDNAAKYTEEGFISLTVAKETEGDIVVMAAEVSDSGIGIKEEDIETLFDDFTRFDSERNRGVQGAGLGLAITKRLCAAMGGSVSVRSEYGVGSTFTITIPQEVRSHDVKFAYVTDPDTKRVLLYETRVRYADSIMRTLENLGVCCALVMTLEGFSKELKRQPYPFVFVSTKLSEGAMRAIEETKSDSTLVLLTEYGEVPAIRGVRTISTPAHGASIANILNDAEPSAFYAENGGEKVRFIAPDASILIVDDLYTNLKVAEGLMLPYQMQVDLCESGEEAIESVQKKRYDLVFMDHMMPEMNGVEAAGHIRALEDGSGYYKNVPIIALTANAISGVKEMYLQSGMDDYLAKPIDVTKLHSLLAEWIPAEKKEKPGRGEKERLSSEAVPASLQIDGVDARAGIAMSGGTVDGYLKMLGMFHLDGTDKVPKIRDCVEKNEIGLYTIHVHAMKSAAANIGALEMSGLFKALEMAGTNNDIGFIQENTECALEKLEALLEDIHAVAINNQSTPAKELHPSAVRSELLRLKEALDSRDAGEISDVMDILEAVKWSRQAEDIFKEISKSILMIDYANVDAMVDRLLLLDA